MCRCCGMRKREDRYNICTTFTQEEALDPSHVRLMVEGSNVAVQVRRTRAPPLWSSEMHFVLPHISSTVYPVHTVQFPFCSIYLIPHWTWNQCL